MGYDKRMQNRFIQSNLHNARVIVSFGLLGAVIAGAFFSGLTETDLRPVGAVIGLVVGALIKFYR